MENLYFYPPALTSGNGRFFQNNNCPICVFVQICQKHKRLSIGENLLTKNYTNIKRFFICFSQNQLVKSCLFNVYSIMAPGSLNSTASFLPKVRTSYFVYFPSLYILTESLRGLITELSCNSSSFILEESIFNSKTEFCTLWPYD